MDINNEVYRELMIVIQGRRPFERVKKVYVSVEEYESLRKDKLIISDGYNEFLLHPFPLVQVIIRYDQLDDDPNYQNEKTNENLIDILTNKIVELESQKKTLEQLNYDFNLKNIELETKFKKVQEKHKKATKIITDLNRKKKFSFCQDIIDIKENLTKLYMLIDDYRGRESV